jgi:galactonate dehydratase
MAWGSMDRMDNSSDKSELLTYIVNREVFDIKDGYMSLPLLPGLGVEVREDLIREEDRKYKAGEFDPWASPSLRGPGGEIREW